MFDIWTKTICRRFEYFCPNDTCFVTSDAVFFCFIWFLACFINQLQSSFFFFTHALLIVFFIWCDKNFCFLTNNFDSNLFRLSLSSLIHFLTHISIRFGCNLAFSSPGSLVLSRKLFFFKWLEGRGSWNLIPVIHLYLNLFSLQMHGVRCFLTLIWYPLFMVDLYSI